MINTIEKINHKSKPDFDHLLSNIYLLPHWEKIKEFTLQENRFFMKKAYSVNLFRKFSSKNMLEKYSLRSGDEKVIGLLDLKVYKDSVYIINIDSYSSSWFEEAVRKLIQIAVEKALYHTSNKEVKINLAYSLLKQNKMKRILVSLGFKPESEQSKYEKEMFGETYTLNVEGSEFWQKKIKQMPILINK